MGYWGKGKWGRRYRYIPAGQIGLKNSCRAPICRNERDRVCRGGGWAEAAGISSRLCLWLGVPAANQAQWFAWERKMEERDHPTHHYDAR